MCPPSTGHCVVTPSWRTSPSLTSTISLRISLLNFTQTSPFIYTSFPRSIDNPEIQTKRTRRVTLPLYHSGGRSPPDLALPFRPYRVCLYYFLTLRRSSWERLHPFSIRTSSVTDMLRRYKRPSKTIDVCRHYSYYPPPVWDPRSHA